MTTRDEFSKSVIARLASRAGHCCSNPVCRRRTSGPGETTGGVVNIGVAAHISAAASGGPRFDPQLTPDQRAAPTNGIWLCQSCAKLIDSDETRFIPTLLLHWKALAESRAQSFLQTPDRPEGADEPILVLPSTDPTVSWLPFSSRATTFVGRDAERAQLTAFLESGRKVSWWLLTGAAGTGKSRLALELCRDARPGWNAGFLSRTDAFAGWSHFRPSRPTLVVIDYVASRAPHVSAVVLQLIRSAKYLTNPVRVLLIERDQGSWWARFLREESHSESTELVQYQHDSPLQLGGLAPEALHALAEAVARTQSRPWTDSIARTFTRRMRTVDPLGRPLFGMMAATYPGTGTVDAAFDSTLLRLVLKKEAGRRREVIANGDRLRKMENLATLATLVGGLLPMSNSFTFLQGTEIASLLPDLAVVDPEDYRELVAGGSDESVFAALQPDILGERFVLDQLAVTARFAESAKRLVRAAWAFQPDDFCDFVVRAASDFPGDAGLVTLSDVPITSAEARGRWARLVGDLVRVANSSTERIAAGVLATLRELADTHPREDQLRAAAARAELYLGNIYLFAEHDYAQAAAQFDIAIARAGPGTEVEAAAINNRGILYHEVQDEDMAFRDWSAVIAKGGISDEARACSLNNRADIFARRGAHEAAIRDRSEVLALNDTSPDRRYIALIRRNRSYLALGRTDEALRDLDSIIRTDDIGPEQKAEALVTRGALFMELGHLVEARNDFDMALAADQQFPGTSAGALVELAELSRLERDAARAFAYLDMASASMDIEPPTLVEVLIVRARLLVDDGDVAGAESVWQSILANPTATVRQKEIAGRGKSSTAPASKDERVRSDGEC